MVEHQAKLYYKPL